MSKWTKFKDGIPKENQLIWISDGIEVLSYKYYLQVHLVESFPYWMERINPDPPEKEKHYCKRISNGGLNWKFTCYEHKSRGLMVTYANDPEIEVTFCPFCGFTLEKK